ncbi:MAG: enoyl-CoA hydratase/isomerase family protein [Nevskia sp.]
MNALVSGPVLLETRLDGRIALLTLNRPEATNAIDDALALALEAAAQDIAAAPRIEAVILTGRGRAFCSGGDVGVFKDALASGDDGELAVLLDRLATRIHGALEALVTAGPLLIAAVNGPATGAGLGLVCACDFAYARSGATLRPGFSKLGLSPDTGTTQFLPRIVGARKALEILVRGDAVTAEAALQLGIYSELIADDGSGDAGFLAQVVERTTRLIASGRAACETRRLLRESMAPELHCGRRWASRPEPLRPAQRSSRKRRGVTPVSAWKVPVKWDWLEKPVSCAM